MVQMLRSRQASVMIQLKATSPRVLGREVHKAFSGPQTLKVDRTAFDVSGYKPCSVVVSRTGTRVLLLVIESTLMYY